MNGMKSFEIDIEIDEEGTVKATVKGVKGKKCTAISEFLDSLGTVTHDSPTTDFYQADEQGLRLNLR